MAQTYKQNRGKRPSDTEGRLFKGTSDSGRRKGEEERKALETHAALEGQMDGTSYLSNSEGGQSASLE